jgi:hypothetical protein
MAASSASEIKASDASALAFAALRLSMLGISLHLSSVRLAETDHAAIFIYRRPNQHVDARPNQPNRKEAWFGIGAPEVLSRQSRIPLKPSRLLKIDAVFGEVRGALPFIPDVRHVKSALVPNAKQRRSVKNYQQYIWKSYGAEARN